MAGYLAGAVSQWVMSFWDWVRFILGSGWGYLGAGWGYSALGMVLFMNDEAILGLMGLFWSLVGLFGSQWNKLGIGGVKCSL